MALLREILSLRHDLAQLLGVKTFAHLERTGVAHSPESVVEFLEQLATALLPKVKQEMELLEQMPGGSDIQQTGYQRQLQAALYRSGLDVSSQLRNYLSLDHCLEGFGNVSILFILVGDVMLTLPPARRLSPHRIRTLWD